MQAMLLTNGTIYTEQGKRENGSIFIDNGKIASLNRNRATGEHQVIELPESYKIIPGFIDLHIHGAGGADMMDATPEALATISKRLAERGTTSFLATTMTQADENIEAALKNARTCIDHQTTGSEILGVHLEGPFISPGRAGAQPSEHIRKGSVDMFQRWQEAAGNHIRLVTLAPEEDNDYALTSYLKETGVVASIGHSDATYEQVNEAVEKGITHATHLFNQMRGLHHREPGVVGATMLNKAIRAELITDGFHVSPAMIQLTYQQLGRERLMLITDAMRAQCMPEGKYDLGGQDVFVEGAMAKLSDGTLAGSILTLDQALKNTMIYTGCSLEDVIQMASYNPAKELGIQNKKGSIGVGKDADLVVLDDNNEVYMTLCKGEVHYRREESE
ncbi:N-acetylglucosamine-6-phosphate deacetylase [Pontibacillus yanchengensis]|uniref:N-acetylglucosamine-6-phosphate deacetylase n=3 Tax=Pontibacillus yanchengensis TaxID=462910 RepID=A0ACC7VGQ5_9BACI|nr:N-acetylglucosamine-6-phosphate deacetylase [Pontibacillus yanchengensis]MYL53967.1 N-acetylglucosamine-6-phosphate deacetylase [Pontibacillus yanchengensis]